MNHHERLLFHNLNLDYPKGFDYETQTNYYYGILPVVCHDVPLLDDGIEAEAAVVHDIAYRAAGDSGANTAAQGFDLRFGIGVLIAYEDDRAGHDIAGISRVQRFLAAEVQAGAQLYAVGSVFRGG